MNITQYLNDYTFDIKNKDHLTSLAILCLIGGLSVFSFKQNVVMPIAKKSTHFSVSLSKQQSSTNITNSLPKQVQQNTLKKEIKPKKEKTKSVSSIQNESTSTVTKEKIESLDQIFDKVEAKEKPANTVPMYDQIDYEKNAAELGFVLKNKDIPLPKLESEESSKNEQPSLQTMPDVNAIANMLYNHLTEEKTETYPELPNDWVRKWQDVEGLVVVVGLLVDYEGNVIKTALIKSSGIPKADTIVQYGLVGTKYDMSTQLSKGQYKWLEIALSFNENTF